MSQRRVVINGEYRWQDEGPSAVASFAIRGGPIQDGPDSAELTRQRSARKKRREAERRDVAG